MTDEIRIVAPPQPHYCGVIAVFQDTFHDVRGMDDRVNTLELHIIVPKQSKS